MPDLWLAFAPVKKGRVDWLVEKAVELGVARLLPVDHPADDRRQVNLDRMRAHLDRGRRAMRAHRACPTSTSRVKLDDIPQAARPRTRRSISPMKPAARRRQSPSSPARR